MERNTNTNTYLYAYDYPTQAQYISCAICGIFPTVGIINSPFTKEGYAHLCTNCFNKIVKPIFAHHNLQSNPPFHLPFHPFIYKDDQIMMWQNPQSSYHLDVNVNANLDARVVEDVTMVLGSKMPPKTSFTKIWRFRNVGKLPFPSLTKLRHFGGDILAPKTYVLLKLPEDGLPVNEEIEVSIDLISPDLPGLYVSYWRLTTPNGLDFGSTTSIMIQVVTPSELSPREKDMPMDCHKISLDVNHLRRPQDDSLHTKINSQGTTRLEIPCNTKLVTTTNQEPEHLNDVHVPNFLDERVKKKLSRDLISKPLIEKGTKALESACLVLEEEPSEFRLDGNENPPNVKNLKQSLQGFIEKARLDSTALFQRNKKDLQKWALLLSSLEEMGFTDKEMNITTGALDNWSKRYFIWKLLHPMTEHP